jgi:uncharacterized membrane protein YfcA
MPDLAVTMPAVLAAWLFAIFLVAGLVKGLVGFGLPWIAVPLMSLAVPVPTAVGWSLVAVASANLAQIYESRASFHVLKIIWPLLLGMSISMILGVRMLTALNSDWLSMVLGVFIQIFVLAQLFPKRPSMQRNRGVKLGLLGAVSGAIGGMTSFVGFPAIQALLALQLRAAEFIFSTSVMFLIGSAILGSALKTAGMMSALDIAISAACVLPVLLGVWLGKSLRDRISPRAFKLAVLAALFGTGVVMIVQPLV